MEKVIVGDTFKIIRFKLSDCDLTGCTVATKYKINGGTEIGPVALSIHDAAAGEADLQSVTGSWPNAGIAEGRVYITFGANVGKSWKWRMEVEAE